jgi:hypothetical protein
LVTFEFGTGVTRLWIHYFALNSFAHPANPCIRVVAAKGIYDRAQCGARNTGVSTALPPVTFVTFARLCEPDLRALQQHALDAPGVGLRDVAR